MTFPDSKIAHRYLDGLRGIEIGASSHNPFHLNTVNVDTISSVNGNVYSDEQKKMCGQVAKVDFYADACKMPFKDKEYDFVINSHVIEHIWRPDVAIKEWCRVASKYIFLIVPHKNRTFDKPLPETSPSEIFSRPIMDNYEDKHHNIWTTKSFIDFVSLIPEVEVVETLDKDDKVGNGFCVVLKIK